MNRPNKQPGVKSISNLNKSMDRQSGGPSMPINGPHKKRSGSTRSARKKKLIQNGQINEIERTHNQIIEEEAGNA